MGHTSIFVPIRRPLSTKLLKNKKKRNVMKWAPLRIGENKMYTFGVIYVMASVIMFGVINYVTWLEGPVTELTSFLFIMWGSLYAPFFIFYKVAGWNVQEFGLVLNRKVLLVIALSFVMGSYLYIKGTDITIVDKRQYSLIEAFARTGEELYARGFIYTLLLKLYADKKDPWKWAVILSTAAFTAMHTQTFLLEYGTFIFQVFLISLFLTYLRHLTDSILPGITTHCFIKGLFGWAIYAVFVMWSHQRGEDNKG